jgi:hypothetical protein
MSQLQVKGNVFFSPGPWGPAKGLDAAQVEIIEHDHASSKVIWTGSTGANNGGAFQGTTTEWQASMTVPIWVVDDHGSLVPPRPYRGHWENRSTPDPTDTMLLTARVTKAPYGTFTTPFVFVNDSVTSPPIVVPPSWVPAGAPVMAAKLRTASGSQSYTDPGQLSSAMKAAVDSGQEFTLEVYEPATRDALANILTRSRAQLLDYLAPRLNVVPPMNSTGLSQAFTGAEIAAIIIALSVLVLAVGASVLTVLIGIAIIYAISKGYGHIEVEMKTDTAGTHYLHVKFEN